MQGKGLVRFFAIIMILACTYQLLFTWKANQVNNRAKKHAIQSVAESADLTGNALQEAREVAKSSYLDSMTNENVLNLLVKKFTYKQCKENQLNLGLDLQGGMSVVLQVSLKELIVSLSDNSKDKFFLEALELAEDNMTNSTDDYVTLFYNAFKELNPSGELNTIFSSIDLQDRINFSSTDQEVLAVIREESNEAVENTFNRIRTRIDQFGVAQPNVSLDPVKGRIIVELAGVDDPERVRKILESIANLELWETFTTQEIGQYLNEANDAVATYLERTNPSEKEDVISLDDVLEDVEEEVVEEALDVVETIDDKLSLLDEGDSAELNSDDLLGNLDDEDTSEVSGLDDKRFPLYSKLKPNADQNGQWSNSPVVGFAYSRDTAKVNEYLNLPEVKDIFPRNLAFFWSAQPTENDQTVYLLYAMKGSTQDKEPLLDGGDIVDAGDDINAEGEVVVNMRMNKAGSNLWARYTGDNIGKFIAVALDDKVYSAPVIQGKIAGGQTQISGNFTVAEASDLGKILKTGKLPARPIIVEEAIVGPSLGKTNIQKSLRSLVFGFLIVIGFMILYYAGAGIIADIVLLLNLFFIIGVLAQLKATLTLPGMAGIVLTIGMAVDANVIIFERIREELRKGKGLKLAIADGYKYSASAIIDANVTTLLTAIILAWVGMGPVLGFATILIIGILSSLFTAVLVSRLLIEWRTKNNREISFSSPISKDAFSNMNIDFLSFRKIAYGVSLAIILAGAASMFTKGFDLGVDFKGGRDYTIKFDEPVNTSDIKTGLDEVFEGGTIVKTFGASSQVKVTTSYLINQSGKSTDSLVERTLYSGLSEFLPQGTTYESFRSDNVQSSRKVDPTISDDIMKSSVKATLLAFLVIFLYILFRFRKYSYGVGAVVTVIHDSLVLLGIFSIFNKILPFSLEIDQAFIAALLTVIGYSLNDTVVVFDRIREYLILHPKRVMKDVVNSAVNDTLSRTIITSLTTLIVVLILFIFGGEVIRGFSFALLIGILVGTYSSVFVATPIMYDLTNKNQAKNLSRPKSKTKKKAVKA